MTNEELMRRAIRLAEKSVAEGGGPFGAVIARDGELIAEASNHVVPHCDPTAHAEVSCIREACSRLGTFNLEGCDIYTSCEPCPMCLGAIYISPTTVRMRLPLALTMILSTKNSTCPWRNATNRCSCCCPTRLKKHLRCGRRRATRMPIKI